MEFTGAEREHHAEAMAALLKLFAQSPSRQHYLDEVVRTVQRWSGCRCVGLRVLDEDGNIPYESYVGFGLGFWETENWLCVRRDQCACIRVVLGKPEPQDALAMTPGGSFRSDDSIGFLSTLTREQRARFRGACVHSGYASLAIVPIRHRDRFLGALHLADEREGMVPPSLVARLEAVSPLIGDAIHRFDLEDELHRSYETDALISRLLRLALEDVPLSRVLACALELIQSVPWLPFSGQGAIYLLEEDVRLPIDGSSHYQVPIRSAGKTLGVMVLPLRAQQPLRGRDRQLLGAVADVLAGVIMRKRAEDGLRASEARFRRLAENAQDLIFRYELVPTPVFSYLSPALTRMLGFAPADLYSDPEIVCRIVHPEDRGKLETLLGEGIVPESLTLRVRHREGRQVVLDVRSVPVEDEGRLVAVEGVARDVTERERMAEMILRAERLEMAGRVAGQVAHDFTNLLTPLISYPQLIRRQLPVDHPAIRYCDALENSAKQMQAINEDLLTLGRRGRLALESVDLNRLVDQTLQGMGEAVHGLELALDLAAGLPAIHGQPAQLQRVIANLLSNALDAMDGSGRLAVRTERVRVEGRDGRYGQVEAGLYVRLTIADTGCGIPPETLDRIFDPFFTTKRTDRVRGSGLGLSIVQAIVRDHGGFVDVESEVGVGTTFSVYLPEPEGE
ncbi:MAG: ATP-binding protein [Sphingomonadaceae bacterium]